MMMMFSVPSPSKIFRFIFLGMILLILLACTVFGITPDPTPEPESFEYCGARLTKLCVVSFGRDALGDTVVNLYVPRMKYPAFYLDIVRREGGGRYECVWNKDVETSVYCVGNPLNLGEGIEIQVRAKLDGRLLAQGAFTVTAFLVATPVVESESDSLIIVEGSSTPGAQTPASEAKVAPAFTETPSASYPNYP